MEHSTALIQPAAVSWSHAAWKDQLKGIKNMTQEIIGELETSDREISLGKRDTYRLFLASMAERIDLIVAADIKSIVRPHAISEDNICLTLRYVG